MNPIINSKGRGTALQPGNRFERHSIELDPGAFEELAATDPYTPSGRFVGGNGKKNEEDFRRCCLGQHFIADPDGVLIDISE